MRKHHTSSRSERTDVRFTHAPRGAGSALTRALSLSNAGVRRRPVRTILGSIAGVVTAGSMVLGPLGGAGPLSSPTAEAATTTATGRSLITAAEKAAAATGRPRAEKAIRFAAAQLGKPYEWGGTGPHGYDCSGLTQASWRNGGLRIARVAAGQYWSGRRVHLRYAKPGDLVFWSSSSSPAAIYHVGLYIGHDRMIDAPHTGTSVQVNALWGGVYPYATRL